MYGLLMIDVAGPTLSEADTALIANPSVGGVILFARNVQSAAQVRQLCADIRQIKSPLLIGIDQEGGRVARLRDGFTPLPAMGRLGQWYAHDTKQALSLAKDCGYVMAAEVLSVGIDVSFAPVLDLNDISQVIQDRSFAAQSEVVVALAEQFIKGMRQAGMASTGKHFPGHGSVAADSHVAAPVDTRPYAQILAKDMQPFIALLSQLDALMPAHVIYSQVDARPAGFSNVWLNTILRQQLGFTGTVFSDDLSMQAAQYAGDMTARIQAAVAAGCDMALVCNDRLAATQAAKAAQTLPPPNQHRLANLQACLPQWQGDLTATCTQFVRWQSACQRIQRAFFSTSAASTSAIDPTQYTP